MFATLPAWLPPILLSAFGLGFYDLCKKHAVRDNPIMPVLFLATLCGSTFFVLAVVVTGELGSVLFCGTRTWLLTFAKALLVAASWSLRLLRDARTADQHRRAGPRHGAALDVPRQPLPVP